MVGGIDEWKKRSIWVDVQKMEELLKTATYKQRKEKLKWKFGIQDECPFEEWKTFAELNLV